jgi:hypothetical protein
MFYVAAGSGNCESARVAVTAILQSGPSQPTTSDVARCGAGTVAITANMGLIPGTVMRLYDSATGGNLLDAKTSAPYILTSSFVTQTTTFYVAVANSSCETPRVAVEVTVGGAPSQPVPVANVLSLCGRGDVTFLANMGTNAGTEIRMYTTANGGLPVAVDNSFPFELRTPVVNTTSTFFLASAIGDCESPRVQVTAVASEAPSAPNAVNVTRCGAGDAVITANMGTVTASEMRLYTSQTSGSAFSVDNSFPYELATPGVTTSSTFFVAAGTGNCESVRVPVTVIVGTALQAPTASNTTICGAGAATFQAINNTFGGTELRLYDAPQGGNLLSTDNTAPYQLTTPVITTTSDFFIATASGNCESPRYRVTAVVLLTSTPSAPVASGVTRCGIGPVVVTGFMGTNPGQEMRLYTAQTGGFFVTSDANAPYELTIPEVSVSGTYFLASASGQCESARTAVSVTVVDQAAIPQVDNVSICGSGNTAAFTANFGGTLPAGSVVSLYSAPFGGNALASTTSAPYILSVPGVNFTSTYYVAVNNGNCEGVRIPAIAVVAQTPTAPSAVATTVCGSGNAMVNASMTTTPGSEMRLYNSMTSTVPVMVDNSAPFSFSVPVSTTSTYYVSAAYAGSCESGRTAVTITVTSAPSIDISSSDINCTALGTITARANGTGTFVYRLNDIGVGVNSGIFTELVPGTYFVTATSNSGCTARSADITISEANGPTSVSASDITANTAIIIWSPMSTQVVAGYEVRYRVAGSSGEYMTVTGIPGTVTTQTLTGLLTGSDYEVGVRGICANGRPTVYTTYNFTTTEQAGQGICVTPTNIRATVLSSDKVRINWTPNVSGAVCYIVSYGPSNTPSNTWPQFLVAHPSSSFDATNLLPGVEYSVRLRTNCTTCGLRSGTITAVSNPVSFTTSGKVAAEAATMNFSVYPNPSNGNFNLNYEAIEEGNVSISVIDLTGRVVYSNDYQATAGMNAYNVDVTGNASGIYMVKVQQGNYTATTKVSIR